VDARLILPLLLWASSAAAAFDHAHPTWDARDILRLPPGASPPLAFVDYDWSLNDFRSSSPR
jgi:hypothetical protein